MRTLVLLVLASSAVLSCSAESVATNVASSVTSVVSTTNAPAAKVSRQQCEAVTKSGNRCKRKAVPDEKLCRQHLMIALAEEKLEAQEVLPQFRQWAEATLRRNMRARQWTQVNG